MEHVMRMILASATLLLISLVPANASTDDLSQQTIVSQGNNRTYYLFVPGGISAERPAALILLLHGSGRNGASLVNLWQDIASREKLVLVGPDTLDRKGRPLPPGGHALL